MIHAIIFDCFGVLYVEARQAYFAGFPQFYDELHDLNKMADHGFIDRQTYIESVARITGVSREQTIRAFSKEHTANRPLIDYIQTLRPQYKIGLLSNIGREWMSDFFDEHQLHDLFDAVVMSNEEGITKPNPLIFERTAKRLGVSPDESIMIDDRQDNCDGAKTAGMHALLYDAKFTPKALRDFIKTIEEKDA